MKGKGRRLVWYERRLQKKIVSFRFRFTVIFILGGGLLVSNFIFMGGRFGSPVLMVKLKPNRTERFLVLVISLIGFSSRFGFLG